MAEGSNLPRWRRQERGGRRTTFTQHPPAALRVRRASSGDASRISHRVSMQPQRRAGVQLRTSGSRASPQAWVCPRAESLVRHPLPPGKSRVVHHANIHASGYHASQHLPGNSRWTEVQIVACSENVPRLHKKKSAVSRTALKSTKGGGFGGNVGLASNVTELWRRLRRLCKWFLLLCKKSDPES